jgi:hypothetical protein
MANHITNILTFENISEEWLKQMLTGIQNDEEGLGSIDFNKIIPMPKHITDNLCINTSKRSSPYKTLG